jgi:glycosyltransferase involved in cell wall biosynthesis
MPPEDFETPLEVVVDEIIVPCERNVETFKELCPDTEVHYVPEGVDSEFFVHHERDFSELPVKIMMFGALTYRKGIDYGIQTFTDLYDGNLDVELHLFTTFHELVTFRYITEGVPNIHVHHIGWSTREEVREIYNSMHALFAPYRGEGYYLPGAEFMATGGLLIAPAAMGSTAYHRPDSGYVIPHLWETVKHWGEHHGVSAARYGEWLAYEPEALKETLAAFVEDSVANKRAKSTRASDYIPFSCDPLQAGQSVIDKFLLSYMRNSA